MQPPNTLTPQLPTQTSAHQPASSPAEAEALEFADAWMAYARERLQEVGTDFEPTIHMLPGERRPRRVRLPFNAEGRL